MICNTRRTPCSALRVFCSPNSIRPQGHHNCPEGAISPGEAGFHTPQAYFHSSRRELLHCAHKAHIFPPLDPTPLKALKRHKHLYLRKFLRCCFFIVVSSIETYSYCSRDGGQKSPPREPGRCWCGAKLATYAYRRPLLHYI